MEIGIGNINSDGMEATKQPTLCLVVSYGWNKYLPLLYSVGWNLEVICVREFMCSVNLWLEA